RLLNFATSTPRALFTAQTPECVPGTILRRKFCGRQDRRLLFGRLPAINLFVPLPGRAIPFFPTRVCPPTESKCAAGRRHCPTICASVLPHRCHPELRR